jgi:cyclase
MAMAFEKIDSMMTQQFTKSRLIPILTKSGKKLIKTVNFKNPSYIGDPLNAVRVLNDMKIDEIIVLDIDASSKGIPIDFEYLERIASNCFSPLSYGGGIKSLEEAQRVFSIGFEKIVLNTALSGNSKIVEEISTEFGNQSIIASIDIDQFSDQKLLTRNSEKGISSIGDLVAWAKQLCLLGIGELMITDVSREGTFEGLNLDFVEKFSSEIEIPFIINGGLNSIQNASSAFKLGAAAVAGSSFFVYDGPNRAVLLNYPSQKVLTDLGLR